MTQAARCLLIQNTFQLHEQLSRQELGLTQALCLSHTPDQSQLHMHLAGHLCRVDIQSCIVSSQDCIGDEDRVVGNITPSQVQQPGNFVQRRDQQRSSLALCISIDLALGCIYAFHGRLCVAEMDGLELKHARLGELSLLSKLPWNICGLLTVCFCS